MVGLLHTIPRLHLQHVPSHMRCGPGLLFWCDPFPLGTMSIIQEATWQMEPSVMPGLWPCVLKIQPSLRQVSDALTPRQIPQFPWTTEEIHRQKSVEDSKESLTHSRPGLPGPQKEMTAYLSGSLNYAPPPEHSPGLFCFPVVIAHLEGAAGESILEGLVALHSLIPDCKQEDRPSLGFGVVFSSIRNTDPNSGSSRAWFCLLKARPLGFLQEASLLCLVFHSSTISWCLRVEHTLLRGLVTVSHEESQQTGRKSCWPHFTHCQHHRLPDPPGAWRHADESVESGRQNCVCSAPLNTVLSAIYHSAEVTRLWLRLSARHRALPLPIPSQPCLSAPRQAKLHFHRLQGARICHWLT